MGSRPFEIIGSTTLSAICNSANAWKEVMIQTREHSWSQLLVSETTHDFEGFVVDDFHYHLHLADETIDIGSVGKYLDNDSGNPVHQRIDTV